MGSRARLVVGAPTLAVAAVAVLWGVTFTLTADTLSALPPAAVVALRFGLAALLLMACSRRQPPLAGRLRGKSLVLGVLLGAGFLLQTKGLLTTDAATSGLLTGLLVVLAPTLETVVFGVRHRRGVRLAVVLAALGLALIGARPTGFGKGELLTIGAAAVWALHLVLTSRWSEPEHALAFARWQTGVVTVLAATMVVGARAGRGSWSPVPVGSWALVGVLAVVCTAVPMVLLTWGQARLDATRTAVILTGEPAVAAVVAALSGTHIDARTATGGVVLIVAMVLTHVASPIRRRSYPQIAAPGFR